MKKHILLTGMVLISIIIIIGIILIPAKTKMNLQSENIVCIRIENYNKSVDITEPSEIEKIIGLLNTLSFKKKHPYKKYLDILTGKDKGFISENIYRISLFTEKREHYVYRDGKQVHCLYHSMAGEPRLRLSDGIVVDVSVDAILQFFAEQGM